MATTYKIKYCVNIAGREYQKETTFISSADNVPDVIKRFKTQLPADSAATFALIECRVKFTNGLTLTSADYDRRRRPAFVTVQDQKAFHCKPSPADADAENAENAENAGNVSVKNASAKILRQYADAADAADIDAAENRESDNVAAIDAAAAGREIDAVNTAYAAAVKDAGDYAADAAVKKTTADILAETYANNAAKKTYYADKAKDAADVCDKANAAVVAAIDAAEIAKLVADTPADTTPNFEAIRQILIDAGLYCSSLYIDDTISEIAEKLADYFGRNFSAFDRAEFLGVSPPRFPDVWQIVNVPDTQWHADGSNLNCLINWILPADIVRLDIIAGDNVPVISFQGNADNVRKHSMAWLSLNCPAFDLSHAAYIGSELERADAERIDYVQDGHEADADAAVNAEYLADVAKHYAADNTPADGDGDADNVPDDKQTQDVAKYLADTTDL